MTTPAATKQPTPMPSGGVIDHRSSTSFRAVVWNLFCGGVDSGGSEKRLLAQSDILADLQPDLLVLPECSWWQEDEERRLLWMAVMLGMVPVAMAPSRIGDGRNFTTMMYRPSRLTLTGRRMIGEGIFHHAMIRAKFRPAGATDDSSDFLALGTHLAHTDGDARLKEARLATDNGGPFPGSPPRGLLMGDLNCPRMDADPNWSKVPRNMHARYRLVNADGTFGGVDVRAMGVLLESGWQDPADVLGIEREATVGYYYANEPVPLHLDHILTTGMTPLAYQTYDTPAARAASDHLPTWLDFLLGLAA